MKPQTIDDLQLAIPQILEQIPYLKLLVLFGSRARGDADENSDWDFAMLYDEDIRKHYEHGGLDWLRVWSILQKAFDLPDEKFDLVDMRTSSKLLAHYIARDGKVLYERIAGEFKHFQRQALMDKAQLRTWKQEQHKIIQQVLSEFRL